MSEALAPPIFKEFRFRQRNLGHSSRRERIPNPDDSLGVRIWEDASDRVHMITQLERGGPIRNIMTRIRTKSGEVKLTAYSADNMNFDGQPCILAVSRRRTAIRATQGQLSSSSQSVPAASRISNSLT